VQRLICVLSEYLKEHRVCDIATTQACTVCVRFWHPVDLS
jgi:hypothetical protein